MNWLGIVITGIIAFFLAMLTGILSGVTFGIILLRSLVTGIVFSGGAAGIMALLAQFLPEVLAVSGETDTEDSSGIDIVLEGDDEDAVQYGGIDYEESGEEQAARPAAGKNEEHVSKKDKQEESGGALEDDDEIAEFAEVHTGGVDDDKEGPGTRAAEDGSGLSVNFDMDDLPELDSFSDSFSGIADSSDTDLVMESQVQRKPNSAALEALGNEKDPDIIAKAVQTVLKKDQEG